MTRRAVLIGAGVAAVLLIAVLLAVIAGGDDDDDDDDAGIDDARRRVVDSTDAGRATSIDRGGTAPSRPSTTDANFGAAVDDR